MKTIILILFLISSQINIAQSDTLYLFIEKPFFQGQAIENIITGFFVNSEDKRFVCDYYKFGIVNFMGWDENGEDVFLNLNELRKEIRIDTINYETISSLVKNKEWWEIHNELSLKKKIYLLEISESKCNSKTGRYDFNYYILPLIYEGTRKNIVPTDLSINKK